MRRPGQQSPVFRRGRNGKRGRPCTLAARTISRAHWAPLMADADPHTAHPHLTGNPERKDPMRARITRWVAVRGRAERHPQANAEKSHWRVGGRLATHIVERYSIGTIFLMFLVFPVLFYFDATAKRKVSHNSERPKHREVHDEAAPSYPFCGAGGAWSDV